MNLLISLVTSSIVGSILFFALLLFRPITKKIFSETWHYYCLIVPLIFLLGGTHIAVSLADLTPYRASQITTSPHEMPVIISHDVAWPPVPNNLFNMPVSGDETDVGLTAASIANRLTTYLERAMPFILAFWILGTASFIVISTKKYLQYRRIVLYNAKSVRNIGCKVPIVVSETAHTPMLIGMINPTIVLPNMHFANDELDMILSHEMVHYRRKDLLVKLLLFIANAVHWFNPAVYALSRQLNATCELSCDEKVVSEMNTQNRRVYGETILQVLQHSTAKRSLVGNVAFATNLCNSKKNFKRRLISMMNTKKMRKSVAALALAIGMLVVGGGFAVSYMVNSAMPVTVYASTNDNIVQPLMAESQPLHSNAVIAAELYQARFSSDELQAMWDAHDAEAARLIAANYIGSSLSPDDWPPFASWTRAELLEAVGRVISIEERHYKMTPNELMARANVGQMLSRVLHMINYGLNIEEHVEAHVIGLLDWARDNYTAQDIAIYEEMGAPRWFVDQLKAEISTQ